MRTVAVLLVLSSIAVLIPQTSANDCANNFSFTDSTRDESACVTFDVRPSTPPPAPGVPPTPYWGTYYLWVGPGVCTSPTSNACRGTPTSTGSGVPLPTGGGSVGVRTFGVLWQETNAWPGLQRSPISTPVFRVPDNMILV